MQPRPRHPPQRYLPRSLRSSRTASQACLRALWPQRPRPPCPRLLPALWPQHRLLPCLQHQPWLFPPQFPCPLAPQTTHRQWIGHARQGSLGLWRRQISNPPGCGGTGIGEDLTTGWGWDCLGMGMGLFGDGDGIVWVSRRSGQKRCGWVGCEFTVTSHPTLLTLTPPSQPQSPYCTPLDCISLSPQPPLAGAACADVSCAP